VCGGCSDSIGTAFFHPRSTSNGFQGILKIPTSSIVQYSSPTYICHVIVHVTVAAMKKAAFDKKALRGEKERRTFSYKRPSLLYKKLSRKNCYDFLN
jgi:hypothetical protein